MHNKAGEDHFQMKNGVPFRLFTVFSVSEITEVINLLC